MFEINNQKDITLKQAFEDYQIFSKAKNLSERTLLKHVEDFNFFDRFYSCDNLCSTINTNIINSYKCNLLDSNLSDNTVDTRIRGLRLFYIIVWRWAIYINLKFLI